MIWWLMVQRFAYFVSMFNIVHYFSKFFFSLITWRQTVLWAVPETFVYLYEYIDYVLG